VNDPVLLLDSTVLVAYERDLSRRAQAVVLEALADGRLMVTAGAVAGRGLRRAGRRDPRTGLAGLARAGVSRGGSTRGRNPARVTVTSPIRCT
jgi:hypothetical protein